MATATATATQTLTYNTGAWGDQLAGTTYDEVGNPLTYNGFEMTWSGRQLTQMSRNGGQNKYTFTYNDEGIRTSKNSNGTMHYYTLNGSQIVSESWGIHLLVYLYDELGAPIGLQYRNTSYAKGVFDTFYFEKNTFGDITGVFTEDGTKIGSYKYDAWGNCTRTAVSGITQLQRNIVNGYNPFRYRGYYYDVETALYYLQSRYYDPSTGRFVNPDGYVNANGDLLGYNMYAYCGNNPVNSTDPTGEGLLTLFLTGAVIGWVSQAISDCVTSVIDEEVHISSPAAYIGAALGGGIGAFIPDPVLSGTVSSAVGTLTEMSLTNCYNQITGEGEVYSFEETFYTVTTNAILGGLCSSVGVTDEVVTTLENPKIGKEIINGIFSAGLGDFFAGTLNSEFGRTMPTSHVWDRRPVRIY